MDPARPARRGSWRGPPLAIKPRRSSSQPSMARPAREPSENMTVVYNIAGKDHYAVIPYPKSYEEALTAAVQRFSQSFLSSKPTRQVWLARGLRTRRNRWIWTECDPETFLRVIEEGMSEIRLCDNEQEEADSDDSSDDCLSVILSEEDADAEGSVNTNMTSFVADPDSRSAKSSASASNTSCTGSTFPSTSPAGITQSLIDDAVNLYHCSTDFETAIAKLEHAASVAPASYPDLKAQCYLHLGYLCQITSHIGIPMPARSKRLSLVPSPTTPESAFSNARSHFRHAHKLFTQSKNREGQLKCKQGTASVALDEQDWDTARNQILHMLDAAKREGVQVDEVWCASALALCALKTGAQDEVDHWWGKVWKIGAR